MCTLSAGAKHTFLGQSQPTLVPYCIQGQSLLVICLFAEFADVICLAHMHSWTQAQLEQKLVALSQQEIKSMRGNILAIMHAEQMK